MSFSSIVVLAAESGAHHEGGGANPWLVGIGSFAVLVVLLLAVVSFGGGRDHS